VTLPPSADFAGRVAIITAASRGIGRASARLLARRGANVVLNARRPEPLEELADEIRLLGREALAVVGDMGVEADRARLIEAAQAQFGRIDHLVSNASNTDIWYGGELPPETRLLDAFYRIDLAAAVHLTELVAPAMREQRSGSIVYVSSVSAKVTDGTAHGYTMIKAALNAAAKCYGVDLARDNVRVNAVAPGSTWEPDNTWDRFKHTNAEEAERIERGIPMGRFGTPEEIASCIAFMLSDEARWVVGQCLLVDGGQYRGIA
jgi:3-oxoacyl-[acyl-carrier protein] reductase